MRFFIVYLVGAVLYRAFPSFASCTMDFRIFGAGSSLWMRTHGDSFVQITLSKICVFGLNLRSGGAKQEGFRKQI